MGEKADYENYEKAFNVPFEMALLIFNFENGG
jgi:hypothetical protein